jgi:methionyl-tRNA formyltransferase
MYPVEIEPERLTLPDSSHHKIIVLTGSSLRHKRFAYRLQSEFGPQVVAWFEFKGEALQLQQQSSTDKIKDLLRMLKSKAAAAFHKGHYLKMLMAPVEVVAEKMKLRNFFAKYTQEEQRIFGSEVLRLKAKAHLEPVAVTKKDLSSASFHNTLKSLDAYFLLTLGGPIYPKEVLESVSGLSINQHAGHSPLYKGSYTTEWELYHRRIEHISSTVHITTSHADAGPILRRSQPTLSNTDNAGSIFCKVVALGTELMIDAVHEIMKSKSIEVYPQPLTGKTYRAKDFTDDIALAITRDLNHKLIESSLYTQRNY